VSDRPTHGWCASCKEDSAVDHAGLCLWCGGETEQRTTRGGWKRPDIAGSRYTEAQLQALHIFHVRDGLSLNELGKRTYQAVGYGSHTSAAQAISREWKRLGLKARDRIEQVRKTCTTHGLSPKHGPRPGYGTYKRRVLQGREDQPLCKGVRLQHPRKGEPCERLAMYGSEYCISHDPERRAEVVSIVERARSNMPEREMVAMAPFSAWLQRQHAELGSWKAVADRVGRSVTLVHAYGRGINTATKEPKHEIGRETVEELLAADGTTTFEELYAPALEAAA